MAEVSKRPVEHEPGCGIIGGIFRSKNLLLKKTISLPAKTRNVDKSLQVQLDEKKHPTGILKTGRSTSADSAVLQSLSKQGQKPNRKPELLPPRNSYSHTKALVARPSDTARSSTSSSSSSSQRTRDSCERKVQISGADQLKLSDEKALVRAYSNTITLAGRLGNPRQRGNESMLGNNSPKAVSTKPMTKSGLGGVSVMGNIVRQPSNDLKRYQETVSRSDPVAVKNMGNEAYRQGNFEEALRFYEKAVSLDPRKAIYWCNKSAALVGLGRLVEAFVECKEAVRLDPMYQRAHHRLATICHRLGEAQQAIDHYNQAGEHANSKEISQAQALAAHLNRSINARKSKEWNLLLKETQSAVSSGANAAPLVYALQVEALIKLQRHQEAYAAHRKVPNFAIESCINFFGLSASAYLLMIRAEIFLVSGRFEDATAAAQHATRLDPGNKEVAFVLRKTRLVSSARLSGNLLFKASKFFDACVVYTDGLEHDPHNSVLLCNRAACRSKLGQFEKAIEDCTSALKVQPSYSKARLRRADCYSKLENWEAAIQDYETVIKETIGDEEVARALLEARNQLEKQQGDEVKDMKFGANVVLISGNEHFRKFVCSAGTTVGLLCNKAKNKRVLQVMDRMSKRYTSVNFVKVDVEDNTNLTKSEGLSSVPVFTIYKNGSRVKEVPANNLELLEKLVKHYAATDEEN